MHSLLRILYVSLSGLPEYSLRYASDSIDFENFDQCVTGCDYSEIRVCEEVAGYFVYGFEPTNVVRQAQINSAKSVLSVILDEDF